MLLAQITAGDNGTFGNNPALKQAVLAAMQEQAPLLNHAQWYAMTGNADTIRKTDNLAGYGENRAVGTDFVAPAASADNTAQSDLRIIGGVLTTDQALERRGVSGKSKVMSDIKSFGKSVARHWMDQFINGDNTGQNYKGIKQWITAGRTITPATDGIQIAYGNSDTAKKSQQRFTDLLEQACEYVGGPGPSTVLVMDGELLVRLKTIARDAFQTTTILDYFGNNVPLTTFGGIPIIRGGYKKDNTTKVLAFNETVGASSDCSSIYAIRFGERADVTLLTNLGLEVKSPGMTGQSYKNTIEFDGNVAVENDTALARIVGLRLAP